MNTATTLLIAGGAYVALTAFKKASSAGTLNFYPANLKSLQMDGITPVVTLGLGIQNPSSQSYTVKAVVGSIYANGFLIGNVSSYVQRQVAATATTIYPLTIRLSLLGIVQDIVNAFNGNGAAQKIELNAYANVNDLNIPIRLSFNIP